jgi:polyisoprenoid-binding protein YceI
MAGSQVWIEGNSSLRRYYFTLENITAKSDLSTSGSELDALLSLILNHKGHQLVVTLPVNHMKSGDAEMDRKAYGKLRAEKYPDIVFTMGNYVIKAFPGSLTTYALLVSGKLKIAGVERNVVLEPTMVLGKDGIKVYGTQDIYQKDYGISPYSVAVVMTTDNKIAVHYMIALGVR